MAESTMPIEVHADVAKSFAKEYVDAVITDDMKILPSYEHRQDTPVKGLSVGAVHLVLTCSQYARPL